MIRGRIRATRRAVTLVVLVVPALALLGCSNTPESGPSDAARPQPTTTAAATATSMTPHQYELIDDLCKHVSLDAVVKVMPHVEEDLDDTSMPNAFLAMCSAALGNNSEPDVGAFSVSLQVFDDEKMHQTFFADDYDKAMKKYSGVDIAGLGQKAVRYVDSLHAPNVMVLDGNATIICNWVTRHDKDAHAPSPEKMLAALEETCRASIASLRKA